MQSCTKLTLTETSVTIGALFEFIWAAAGDGIAIGLHPLLKKYNGALALGSVGFRVVEAVFVLIVKGFNPSTISVLSSKDKFSKSQIAVIGE